MKYNLINYSHNSSCKSVLSTVNISAFYTSCSGGQFFCPNVGAKLTSFTFWPLPQHHFLNLQEHSQLLKVYFRLHRTVHRRVLLQRLTRDQSRWNSHSERHSLQYLTAHSPVMHTSQIHELSGHQYSKQEPFIWRYIKKQKVTPLETKGPDGPRTLNTRSTVTGNTDWKGRG